MKKYTRKDFSPRGNLPPQLFKYIDMNNISDATAQFSEYMTHLAKQFHSQVNLFGLRSDFANLELDTPNLFGQTVSMEYIDSGSTGSVYKITIGTETFAFKINYATRMATDELESMHIYRRFRNLVNRTHISAPFKYNGEEFTWLLSDYVSSDYSHSFDVACEKLYFAYITKGIAFSDGHYNNFKNGKIIDTDSFRYRVGGVDDFDSLSRTEKDTIKKLARYIKTNDKKSFSDLLIKSNQRVIDYLFFSMVYARGAFLRVRESNATFTEKIKSFEVIARNIRTERFGNLPQNQDVRQVR